MVSPVTPIQAAVLGVVQGLTEFLPVSSSAHLYVVPTLLGWPYAGVAFDVALHWGTLFALLVAFAGDWWRLVTGLFARNTPRQRESFDLLAKLAAASVPGAVAGYLLQDLAETRLRALPIQAVMLLVFGALLWAVDRFAPPGRREESPGWLASIGVGFAQALALVPGVSRSGITMTAGRAVGMDRVSSARFSFLLATPITFGAGLLELRHVPHTIPASTLAIGVLFSAVTGLLAIRGLLRWLSRAGFGAFFVYRAALALFIFIRLRNAG